jgi:hypothetical protein
MASRKYSYPCAFALGSDDSVVRRRSAELDVAVFTKGVNFVPAVCLKLEHTGERSVPGARGQHQLVARAQRNSGNVRLMTLHKSFFLLKIH